MNIVEAKKLVHYAIDKASPFPLDRHPNTKALDQILAFPLVNLGINTHGFGLMWLWINAYIGPCGGKPVSPPAAAQCRTVADVWAAVQAAAAS